MYDTKMHVWINYVIAAFIGIGWLFLSFWSEPFFPLGSMAWLILTAIMWSAAGCIIYFRVKFKARGTSEQPKLRYDTPIHKVVDYVALRIDDSNSGNCYLATRHAMRVASKEGTITLYGKKKVKGSSEPSALHTKIPTHFLNDQQLTKYSTEDRFRHWIHTEPEIASNGDRIGESKDQYWEILISMDEVKKRWP